MVVVVNRVSGVYVVVVVVVDDDQLITCAPGIWSFPDERSCWRRTRRARESEDLPSVDSPVSCHDPLPTLAILRALSRKSQSNIYIQIYA